jgi:hypothetical protein
MPNGAAQLATGVFGIIEQQKQQKALQDQQKYERALKRAQMRQQGLQEQVTT